MREKSERSQSVSERDDNGSLLCEARAVMPLLTTKTGEEPATVNPHHHRPARCARAQRRTPHVEIEAVLGDASGIRIDVSVRLSLHAVVTELAGGSNAGPTCRRPRRTPSQRTDGKPNGGLCPIDERYCQLRRHYHCATALEMDDRRPALCAH